MILHPSTDYRYVLRRPMQGTDVVALQLNLETEADGRFGKQTEKAVKEWQASHSLTADGIAGPTTQQSLCVELSTPAARKYQLPVGLAKSIMAAESGFYVAAVSAHPSDSGLDIGAWQRSTGAQPGTQDFYRSAYTISISAEQSAGKIRETFNQTPTPVPSRYLTEMADGDASRFKWQMAVLSHNWPVAAYKIPFYGYIYDIVRDDQPAAWIESASAGRLSTPREWVMDYVQRCTTFCRW